MPQFYDRGSFINQPILTRGRGPKCEKHENALCPKMNCPSLQINNSHSTTSFLHPPFSLTEPYSFPTP